MKENKDETRANIVSNPEMYRQILETVPDVMWVLNEEYRCTYVNGAVFAMYGYTPEEAMGATMSDSTPPEDLARVHAAMFRRLQSLESGVPDLSPYKLELRQYRKDGTLFWIETTTTPIVDQGGRFQGVIGSSRDITAQKEAEFALARRVQLERAVSEMAAGFIGLAPDAVDGAIREALKILAGLINADRTLVHLFRPGSSVIEDVYEWCAPGVMSARDFWLGRDLAEAASHFWKVVSAGRVYHAADVVGMPADAQGLKTRQRLGLRSVLAHPMMLNGNLVGYMSFSSVNSTREWTDDDCFALGGACRSIMHLLERRRVEEELARSREEVLAQQQKLALAMEMARLASWEYDFVHEQFIFSDALFALYGTSAEREGGYCMSLAEYGRRFVHPDDMGIYMGSREHVYNSLGDRIEGQFEYRIVRRDDEVRNVVVRYSVTRDGEGRPVRGIGTNQDITERKQTEERLKEAMQAAEAASRAKSEFLANMSHEIRTPLNGIMGMLQLMDMCTIDDEAREYGNTAVASCQRLASLIGDILDLSRIEAGHLTIDAEPFSVLRMVESVGRLFGPAATHAGLYLHVRVEPGIPELLGDSNRILQILNNFVGNSIKFTRKGGIDVNAYSLSVRTEERCRICFEVTDTGMGIADDMLGKLFKPFTQVDGSYTRKHQGAGLGLSITKRLIDMMGGTLSVISEEGVGTTMLFCLTLPVARTAEASRVQ